MKLVVHTIDNAASMAMTNYRGKAQGVLNAIASTGGVALIDKHGRMSFFPLHQVRKVELLPDDGELQIDATMAKNRLWSDDDTSTLRRMHHAKASTQDMAEKLNRTPSAVIAKLSILGLLAPARRFDRLVADAVGSDDAAVANGRAGGKRSAMLRAEEAASSERRPWHPARDPRPAWLRA